VIHGENGVGKTNLLDAIYALAMTKSNFSMTDVQLIREEEAFFRVEGEMWKGEEEISLVLKLQRGRRKVVEQNSKVIGRAVDHIGVMPVVMITPDDLNLINASNSERRKLADTTLSQIDRKYLDNLVTYNRLLKQRNSQLKQWQESGTFDRDLLETYDRKMTEPARIVFEYRKVFFSQLLESIQGYYDILCEGREPVHLEYESDLETDTMLGLAQKNLGKDRATCRTSRGIHRDVIDCFINGKNARTFASEGQKKSLIFAIKLAQLDYMKQKISERPILLLDDVFDKLDFGRVKRLLSIILNDTFGQAFITDTQWERMEEIILPYDLDFVKHKIEAPVG